MGNFLGMKTRLLFIGLLFLWIQGAKAQDIELNYNHEINGYNTYYIDLDEDGVDDLEFLSGTDVVVYSVHSNAKILKFSANDLIVKILSLGQTISNTMTGGVWSNSTTLVGKLEQQYTHSFWNMDYAGFIPVQVNNKKGYILFGAGYSESNPDGPESLLIISSRLSDSTSITIPEFATGIETTPSKKTQFKISQQNQVFFDAHMMLKTYFYTVHNLLGQIVETGTLKHGQTLLENTGVSESMYILSVLDEKQAVLATTKFLYSK